MAKIQALARRDGRGLVRNGSHLGENATTVTATSQPGFVTLSLHRRRQGDIAGVVETFDGSAQRQQLMGAIVR